MGVHHTWLLRCEGMLEALVLEDASAAQVKWFERATESYVWIAKGAERAVFLLLLAGITSIV
jgi:hypothetical protein